MEWDIYKLEKEDLVYKFCSEGPRGKIIKIIQFQHEGSLGINVFNLAFGNFIEATGGMDDKEVSNNGDQLKILHTVAEAVIDFLGSRPKAIVVIQGSTSSRIRLYQIRIASFLSEVSQQFEILGELEKEWVPFQRGINYKRFLVYKKIK
jgi:hypothetical protein